jgi:hypothetical protein
MATQPDDDALILDNPADDQDQQDDQGGDDQQQDQQEAAEEDEIFIGDDLAAPAENDSSVIRHLRDEIRKRDRIIAERPAPQAPKIEVGPKPDLWEDCEGDPDKFEAALTAWHDRQRQADAQKTADEKQAEAANASFRADVQRFEGARSTLKVAGAPEAIDTALASLSPVQQAALVTAADNAALVAAALGKHPAKLADLAGIENPIKFAVAVAKLEGTLKVAKRKAPDPEEVATGSASVRSESSDKVLERLQKEADKTGDRTKLIAHKRAQEARAKA